MFFVLIDPVSEQCFEIYEIYIIYNIMFILLYIKSSTKDNKIQFNWTTAIEISKSCEIIKSTLLYYRIN